LVLKNLDIEGLSADALQSLSDTSKVVLENVQICQSGDYLFEHGFLDIRGKSKITSHAGPSSFTYRSSQPLTIHANSSLTFSSGNSVFIYDPSSGDKNLLIFEDYSSSLALDQAELHVTATGLQLTGGTLLITGNSVISSEHCQEMVVTDAFNKITRDKRMGYGIELGSGDGAYDMKCCIKGNVQLRLGEGSLLTFNNANTGSFVMENTFSSLYIGCHAALALKMPLVFEKGTLCFDSNSHIYTTEQPIISGNVQFLGQCTTGNLET
jgi:hypothetical protein